MNNKFTGTGVALITPFNSDGSVDFSSLERVVAHTIDGGVDYLLVMGTTAENATLNKEERQTILRAVVKQNNGRLPIVYGIGCNNTQTVIDDVKNTDLLGVDGLLVVAPYYNKPNQEGLYQHFAAIAESSPLPIILYNVPGRTGVTMSAATTLRLAHKYENIVAIKEASGNLNIVSYILKDCPADFAVISGDDNLTLPIIALGGVGVISVSANCLPKEVSDCVRACLNNDYAEGNRILKQLLEFQDFIFAEGNPTGIKSAMSIKGLIKNYLRLPLVPSSESYDKKMEDIIKVNSL